MYDQEITFRTHPGWGGVFQSCSGGQGGFRRSLALSRPGGHGRELGGFTEDLGEMRLADGRAVIGLNSAQTARDGTLCFVGAIELREEPGQNLEYAGKIGNIPYRLALVIYRPGAQNQP